MTRTTFTLISTVIAAAALMVLGPPVSAAQAAPASTATGSGCAPVAIVALRGSGENGPGVIIPRRYTPTVATAGWEGTIASRLLSEFYRSTPTAAGTPIVQVPGGPGGYPAVKVSLVDDVVTEPLQANPLYRSAQAGVRRALAEMARFRAARPDCASTRFVLIGHSQGAMVARGVALAAPEQVAGLLLYGDPFQLPGRATTAGPGRFGTGALRLRYGGQAPLIDRFYRLRVPLREVCHRDDAVCGVTPLGIALSIKGYPGPHDTYAQGDTAAARAERAADVAFLRSVVLG
ncbi:alpha/beta hydrolase [Williamsia sp. CHRR-6]|uniref:alpha/beta hydrolase n=1 Tax=Williamsia sp. CHRR-6 TaxID=2835871 RepID=UPI001BD9A99F|nr:cutinase family protein [Williamsia sp. CHRR-6]MBT0567708.1 cutinase family protein [Williamsia sp. CHRR-6]